MVKTGPYQINGPLRNTDGQQCGLEHALWNGDRSRGWTFYCACGLCTPMRRSYEEGFDLLEAHYHGTLVKAAA